MPPVARSCSGQVDASLLLAIPRRVIGSLVTDPSHRQELGMVASLVLRRLSCSGR